MKSKSRWCWIDVFVVLFTTLVVALLSPAGLSRFHVHAEFVEYTNVALDPWGQIFGHNLDRYYLGRVFPSLVVYGIDSLLRWPHDMGHVLRAFSVMQVCLVPLVVWAYGSLLHRLSFDVPLRCAAYVSLFVGFLFWHHIPYVTATTDVWGLLLSIWMFESYLAGRTWALYVVLLVGAFTWPTIPAGCVLLLLFPYRGPSQPSRTPVSARLAQGAAVLALGIWAASALYMLHRGLPSATLHQAETLPLAPVCFVVVGIYLYLAFTTLLNDARLYAIRETARILWRPRTVAVLTVMLGLSLVQHTLSPVAGQTAKVYFGTIIAQVPLYKPGNFLLTNFLFWGPAYLFMVRFWPELVRRIQSFGIGWTVYIALGVLPTIGAEPRMIVSFLAPLIPLVAIDVRRSARSSRSLALYVGVSLLFSKIWVGLHVLPGTAAEWWWATYGMWMTNRMYVVQGCVALVAAALLVYGFSRKSGLPVGEPECAGL